MMRCCGSGNLWKLDQSYYESSTINHKVAGNHLLTLVLDTSLLFITLNSHFSIEEFRRVCPSHFNLVFYKFHCSTHFQDWHFMIATCLVNTCKL